MVVSALVVSALVLAVAYDGDPDAGKGRRDRGMRLVHGDPHPQNLREPLEDGFGDRAGRGLDQPTPTGAERLARDLDLVLHHAVVSVQREPGDEDGIGHRALPMAAATRSACTVSATSWVRMIAAPPATARRWAAIDPPSR